MSKHVCNWLCLGDSYTVGEAIPLHQAFPAQVVQLLRQRGYAMHAPEVVAQTGWTSFELAEYLIHHHFEPSYDFVTLLVGVNDQYRGLGVADFANSYEFLLRKAVGWCRNKERQVLAISIPDWSVTPFGLKANRPNTPTEIDLFNHTALHLAQVHGVEWLDVTTDYRQTGGQAAHLAGDGLHPSAALYAAWADRIAAWMMDKI